MERASLIGRTFGDFLLTERLGVGGAGEVFRAEQVTLGREAVVKVMAAKGPAQDGDTSDASQRFLREVRLASQLDHPFAAHIYGFGAESDGALWIAMELVRGDSLDALIKAQGAIPLARFAPFFDRLCEVVHAMHEQGIIHRDLKPHNVMVLSRAGRLLPKLLDLGIARRSMEDADKHVQFAGEQAQTLSQRLAQSETLDLTMDGRIVGTPHYLPPEQWRDAAHADARSDIYSLTILAYQALTGDVPFADRAGLFALAAAHARAPLPPLPENLPSALYEVLSKGAAKKPEDRYATVLALASAVRAASGIGVEPLALPQLDKALIDALISEAPQPLAEAVALLEGARTPKQQLEAVAMTRRVFTRYLSLLALACRGRVGPGGPQDHATVVALLERLAVGVLRDDEWLTLARELCRPFAFRKNAHPLPELIAFFFADAAPGHGDEALQALSATAWPEASANDEAVHAALLKLVPALGLVLQRLAFLFDYALIVSHEANERWMGTRRLRRLTQAVSAPLATGLPFLVDRVGAPVVTLSPLMQVIAPSGGMPEELFFLDGAGRTGARMVALPGPFERQSDEVWAWLGAHVCDVTRSQAAAVSAEKPPYKGLSTFTPDDADNYFGREREAESFANRLRLSRLLAVVGPSGTGKSSFVLAGVLPLLPTGWRAVVARPGANPFAALQTHLAAAGFATNATVLGAHMIGLGDSVVAALRDGESLLLVIDQFEELITLCPDPAVRTAFAQALVAAAEHASGRLRVVLTLRDDFLIKAQQLAPLADRLSSSLQLLATPAEEDLLRVVTEPARRVRYTFDDAELPREMVRAVAQYPGALALLSFTASQMWELRDRQLRQLRAKTYEALGGVGGALAHHAEATLSQMSDGEQKLVREIFRHLVTAQGTRAVLSRQEMREVLGASAAAQSVVEKLTVARLLVTSEAADGDDRIEIIHEALIVAWPRLVAWQREDAETARLRDSLRASARQWEERGRPRGLLWRAETLDEYKVWRARYAGRLTASEEQFAQASVRDEARGRRIRRALSVAAFAVLAVGLVVIFRAYREAQHRFLAMREEQGRLALIDDHPMEALAYLHEAARGGADNSAIQRMTGLLGYTLSGARGIVNTYDSGVWRLRTSPDRQWLAALSQGRLAGLTRLSDGAGATVDTEARCFCGEFSRDSRTLFLGCTDGKVRALDVASKKITARWPLGGNFISDIGITDDPHVLLVGQTLAGLRRLDLASGAVSEVFVDKSIPSIASSFSPDGATLVVFGGFADESATSLKGLLLRRAGEAALTPIPLPAMVSAVSYAPDSKSLAVACTDGEVGVLTLATKKWAWLKNAHAKPVRAIAFSQDGTRLVSGAPDAVKMWSASGALEWEVAERASIANVCWAPDGSRIFAGGFELSVFALDAHTGTTLWRHFGHAGTVEQCAVSPDGKDLYTASLDATVRRWDASLRRDREVTGISDASDIEISSKTAAVVSLHGADVIDSSGQAHALFREEHPPTDALAVAIARDDTVAVVTGNRLRLFRADASALLDTPLPQAGVVVRFNPSATKVLVQTGDFHSAFAVGRDGALGVPQPKTEDGATFGAFISDTFFVGCGEAGKLRVFDTDRGALAGEMAAHKSLCIADVVGDQIVTFSDDKDIAFWSWDGTHLKEKRRLATTFLTDSIGRGPLLQAIDRFGGWDAMSDDGLLLGHLTLRRDPLSRSTGNRDRFVFIDKQGGVAQLTQPPAASVSVLDQLYECRGIWDSSSGRLLPRQPGGCVAEK